MTRPRRTQPQPAPRGNQRRGARRARMSRPIAAEQPAAVEPAAAARRRAAPHATRAQRYGAAGRAAAGCSASALQLFASVLLPFVAAAGIAYFLDPPATRLARLGVPRGLAACCWSSRWSPPACCSSLLLYPLILAQIGMLISRAARLCRRHPRLGRRR